MSDISIGEFQKLDIRIGTVVKAEVPEWSHWVMKLTVDIGPLENDPSTHPARFGRQKNTIVVFSGIMKFYKPQDLEGKQFPFIINLEPKKIGPEGDISEGMMLMVVEKDDPPGGEASETTPPVLLIPKENVPDGTKIM
ncbi:hypothetical protein A3A76_00695 [Candidatus Woesebacteria bacterium RIFCSPLOWO2_01_FULL_39_23]|uniref:tRNA-binding domain-containing protein n=1 Tax=Candidatus Woesebacteria bacterium RIFCSPHIGHO2_01_FULL_40_22 TaxID=1802499 RepID=A0A1F7YHD2_9BACT|nr:MAG: hypothetical protein A2141_05340 [Candidatus Woesebacteria bacterium RBG_16_40_11]OGM26764.1 MAG: hypothetical protein A2628_04370 [Candidatus Woesebacteria bacterium RIFCSPHIGHO2_01_FULL_40_22]OGM38605.1 MAG: hypothetical protein A3E41_00055 [Candidatus Woesebacteria bacterium RIFCSPHIGHO2_12_FULL_38_9]OGM63060.1 MAG: hypothetical protein A3A76_00695 [Candidatus Woesebacteria bacterium RIFCSPLOWO2_01_FULL_39_23]